MNRRSILGLTAVGVIGFSAGNIARADEVVKFRIIMHATSVQTQDVGDVDGHTMTAMLGFEVAQSTVSKYMVRGGAPPSQSWKTFLRNHAQAIAAIDLCVVPTLTFERLFAFLVLGHGLSFPKIQSGGIGAVRQNQRIIRCDVCDHPPACNLHSRSVQAATPA
jgi:hypothetical protein